MRMTLAALAALMVSPVLAHGEEDVDSKKGKAAAGAADNRYQINLFDPVADELLESGSDQTHDLVIEHDAALPCLDVRTEPTPDLQVRIAFRGKDPKASSATVVPAGVCLELPVGKHGQLRGCVISDGSCQVVRDLGKYSVSREPKPKAKSKVRPGGKARSARSSGGTLHKKTFSVTGGVCFDTRVFQCSGATGRAKSGKCDDYHDNVIFCPEPGKATPLKGKRAKVDKVSAQIDALARRFDGFDGRLSDIENAVVKKVDVPPDKPGGTPVAISPTVPVGEDDPCVRARLRSLFFLRGKSVAARTAAARVACDEAHRARTGKPGHK